MNNKFYYELTLGLPENGQVWFQVPAAPVMEGIIDLQLEMSFHFIYILTIVCYGLLGSVVLFNEKSSPFSSRVSHWTSLERIYSIIPMLSIACIYAPSFSLLYAMDEYPDSYVCVKIVGRQWYWHYEVTYDGFNHYNNISNFVNTKILNNNIFKYNDFFNHIKSKSIFNLNQCVNIDNYFKSLYNVKYLVSNKFGWIYKQNYNLHIKLFSDLHKNIVSLPKINNYSFNSYCLSDYTLKAKYLSPKIMLANLKVFINKHFVNSTNNINFKKDYAILLNNIKMYNNNLSSYDNLAKFKTIKTSRLLDTTKALIIPTGTVVRALVTASDVIHSWSVPSLGVKTDGIPGRLNQVFFAVIKNGIYYGQCSELCGQYHFAMPIVVKSMNWFSCNLANCFWCKLQPSFNQKV